MDVLGLITPFPSKHFVSLVLLLWFCGAAKRTACKNISQSGRTGLSCPCNTETSYRLLTVREGFARKAINISFFTSVLVNVHLFHEVAVNSKYAGTEEWRSLDTTASIVTSLLCFEPVIFLA